MAVAFQGTDVAEPLPKASKQITNYRVEKITRGYILHVTYGAQQVGEKYAFLDRGELLRHLEKVL